MREIIKLASNSKCTGCGACAASCNIGAIAFDYDRNGFLRPTINPDLCKECKACVRNCPVLNKHEVVYHSLQDQEYYSAWTVDDKLCKECTSGGVFSQIAINFLQEPNSYVYGAYLHDNKCKHIECTTIEDLKKIRGTKYIQSDASEAIRLAKKRIASGGRVLFSGTPCQVSAVNLAIKNKENLFTIEVLCHGTPSKLMTDLTCKHNGYDFVVDYRNKNNGWKKGLSFTMVSECNMDCGYDKQNVFHFWSMDNLSCYKCSYARPNRTADMTLGDQWALYSKYGYRRDTGVSLVISNTPKGNIMLDHKLIHSEVINKDSIDCPVFFIPFNQIFYINYSRSAYRFQEKCLEDFRTSLDYNWRKRVSLFPMRLLFVMARKIYQLKLRSAIKKFRRN